MWAFQTPLATLHKWQGFADVFLATPSEGLIDRYAWAAFPLPFGLNFRAIYHDFSAEAGRGHFGHEYNVLLFRKFRNGLRATGSMRTTTPRQGVTPGRWGRTSSASPSSSSTSTESVLNLLQHPA